MEEYIKDFNDKIDKLRHELLNEAIRLSTSGRNMEADHYHEMSNQMECARRVFNHYMETGEVKVPD